VRRNKLIGSFKNIDFSKEQKSTILEAGINYAERTCFGKISRNTKRISKSKVLLYLSRKLSIVKLV